MNLLSSSTWAYGILFFIILLLLFLLRTVLIYEPFETVAIDSAFLDVYTKWRTRYLLLAEKWKTALVTAVGLERPAPTDGSQTPPPPTLDELNTYVTLLSQKIGAPLPSVRTDVPPETITMTDGPIIKGWETAMDAAPWIAALDWTNTQMEQSFVAMEHALRGGGSSSEGFLNVQGADRCQGMDVVQCVEQHPEILDKWMTAQKEKEAAALQSNLAIWKKKMENMIGSAALSAAIEKNNQLAAKAKEVQNKASSGALLNELQLPADAADAADTVKGLPVKQLDPATYNEYKNKYSGLLSLKATIDSINSGLH